jgi:hypothetical protein
MVTGKPEADAGQNVDAAALAGAALAGALAVFLQEGPFDWLNGVVGATLLAIVVGYELDRPRTASQSVAIGAVFAFCSLLIVGLVWELVLGEGSLDGTPAPKGDKMVSRVPTGGLALVWLILAAICCVADRRWQKRRDPKRS